MSCVLILMFLIRSLFSNRIRLQDHHHTLSAACPCRNIHLKFYLVSFFFTITNFFNVSAVKKGFASLNIIL